MSRSPWPAAFSTGKPIVGPLPLSVLHRFVVDLPGPKDETDAARAARFAAQLAELLSYHPRNALEAMLATHCILFRLVANDARRDANRCAAVPAMAKRHERDAKQFDKIIANKRRMLADFQSRPSDTPVAVAMSAALARQQFLVPVPASVPDDTEEAFSAVIVPLHPAPKTLQ
jgi:hypothetical protein